MKGQRIRDNQFVISLYVNDQLVDGYRALGTDTSLACSKIVGTGDYLPDQSVKFHGIQGGFIEIPPGEDFCKNLPDSVQMKTLK